MFEGKPPLPGEARMLDEPLGSECLRPLQWSDLVARLAAARELRASFGGMRELGEASFDAGCARRVAAHHNGKYAINLDDLGNGKVPGGMAGQAVHGAASGVARK